MLLRQMKESSICPFHQYFTGHKATNYTKWVTASHSYVINWVKDYEPYVLVRSNVVRYDERFMGYGFNKLTHIAELGAQCYEFVVLPDHFLIHYPHPLSADRLKVVGFFKICLKDMYLKTLEELSVKYGWDYYTLIGKKPQLI